MASGLRVALGGLGLACLLLTACGGLVDPLAPSSTSGSGSAGGTVVVGSAASTESHVLAELYAQALTAKGVAASTKPNLGTREEYLAALSGGSISLVPEYSGRLLLHYDENATATTAAEVDDALPKALPSDLALGKPAKAVRQDTYVVTRQFSRQHRVTSLAGLKRVPGGVVLGGPPGLDAQSYGPQGLAQVYGVKLSQVKPYDSSAVRSRDLKNGRIQLAQFASTEAVILDNGYVALADPQAMILPQHVVPLMRAEVAGKPAVTSTLDAVQSALTTRELTALDKSVDVEHEPADQVARAWLQSEGLA